MLFKRILALCTVMCAFASTSSLAEIIDIKEAKNKVYFLSQSPNKVYIYDLATKSFDDEIALTDTPTAFEVNDSDIYVGYSRVLKRIDLSTRSEFFIRNSTASVTSITATQKSLHYQNKEGLVSVLNADGYVLRYNYNQYSNIFDAFFYSDELNSIFAYSRGQVFKFEIDEDESVKKTYSYHLGGYNSTKEIALDPFSSQVLVSDGTSLTAFDLNKNAKSPTFDKATFAKSNLVACKDDKAMLYDSYFNKLSESNISLSCNYMAYFSGTAFVFDVVSRTNVLVEEIAVEEEVLTDIGVSLDPAKYDYKYKEVILGEDGVIYLYDDAVLHIHRWSIAENKYLSSIKMKKPIVKMAYDSSLDRLYVSDSRGAISYFEPKIDLQSKEFSPSSNNAIKNILVRENHLVTYDGRYLKSWDSKGVEKDSINTYGLSGIYKNANSNELITLRYNRISTYSLNDSGAFESVSIVNVSNSFNGVVAVDDRGEKLIIENGSITSLTDGGDLGVLSSDIRSATWTPGGLITIAKKKPVIQFWSDQLELESDFPFNGVSDAKLFSDDENLVVVRQLNTVQIDHFDVNAIPDTDEDGKHDLIDNCKAVANSDQLDTDADYIGNACDADDDNDGIPDTVEEEKGLDPLNAADAILDLDQDGFTNMLEFVQNSDMNDSSSVPNKLDAFYETFDTWPAGFYTSSINGWRHVKDGTESYLQSSDSLLKEETSSLYWTGYVVSSAFQYETNSSSVYAELFTVYLDGNKISPSAIYTESQQRRYNIPLTEGQHVIEFRVEKTYDNEQTEFRFIDNVSLSIDSDLDGVSDAEDNCPLISNRSQYDADNDGKGNECDNTPWGNDRDNDDVDDWSDNCPDTPNFDQADIDNDGRGDVCDSVDDRPVDHDNDGYAGYSDNCPYVANPDQADFDRDRLGDACDEDIDGDGLSNELEDSLGLNSKDASDSGAAWEDPDGDGAISLYEVLHNRDPNTAETFEAIDLTDYMPLGRISYVFDDGSPGGFPIEIIPTNTKGRYLQIIDGLNFLLENREDGIYSVEVTSNFSERAMRCENNRVMPRSLVLGEMFKVNATCTVTENGAPSSTGTITIESYLSNLVEVPWNGEKHLAVEFTDKKTGLVSYMIKGIGGLSYADFPLRSMDAIDVHSPVPIYSDGKKDDDKGIGGISALFMLSLGLVLASRRRRFSAS